MFDAPVGSLKYNFSRTYVYLNPDPTKGPPTYRLSNIAAIDDTDDCIENLWTIPPIINEQAGETAVLKFNIESIPNDHTGARATSGLLPYEVAGNVLDIKPMNEGLSCTLEDIEGTKPIQTRQNGEDITMWFDITSLDSVDTARAKRERMKVTLGVFAYNNRSVTSLLAEAPLFANTVAKVSNCIFRHHHVTRRIKMALEASDLMVVQKQSGAKEIRKASLQALSDYLQTTPGVVYKGVADFTDAGDNPGTRNTGDLYINNSIAEGAFAWTPAPDVIPQVDAGDRALWNGTGWDIIQSGTTDAGVEEITATLPLTVSGEDATPNIEIRNATTTLSGVVTRLATVDDTKKDGTGSTEAVVTADLLKQTNIALDAATAGGVTGVIAIDPIEVFTDGTEGSASTQPAVGVKSAATDQLGVVELFDKDIVIADPSGSADYATWIGTLDASKAMTLQSTAAKFVWQDFDGLEEA